MATELTGLDTFSGHFPRFVGGRVQEECLLTTVIGTRALRRAMA